MSNGHVLKFYREFTKQGWQYEVTAGSQIRLTHPQVRGFVMCSLTPSDHRAKRNIAAFLRRALRDGKAPGLVDRTGGPPA